MKIVVAGGSGFIGRSLVARMRADNHTVVTLTRAPAKAGSTDTAGPEVVQWDGRTMGEWAACLDGADAIVNLAGESLDGKRWTSAQKERIMRSRVEVTHTLRDAVARASRKPSVLVNASAVGYYGSVEEGDVTEEYPSGKGFLAETCVSWENGAESIGELGLRVVKLRLGVVLAAQGGALRKMVLPFRLFAGGPMGSGRQWFPWVHCDDVTEIAMLALQNASVIGPVNVTAPESVNMKTFCAALGGALHRPSWAPVPAALLRIALGEMSDMLLTGQRVVPAKLQRLGYTFRFPTLALALSDIIH